MKPRIVIAMSGGVDSSTAAALLVEQGFDVVGATLKLYDASGTSASAGGRCCSPRDIEDARATAAMLGFPHYVLDRVDAFQEAVIDDFVAGYRAGRTPSPCVRCNERIKFGPLLAFARAVGADALATGHYARLSPGPRLFRAVDRDKDQSYFLFGVRPDVLAAVRFPLGELTKAQVREVARRVALPNADKRDSQQLCFIPDGDHRAFLAQRAGAGPAGVVRDEAGRVLGAHTGTHAFTIGQRKGVPASRDGVARFVARIDVETGEVHVAPRDLIGRRDVQIDDVRWLEGAPADAVRVAVQIRHHSRAHAATVAVRGKGACVSFDEPVEAVAPGQAAVFYADDDRVLGGGWIAGEPTIAPAAPGFVPEAALRAR